MPAVRRELAAIAATQAPFEVTFATVERFPDVVYLAPRPAEPFTRLTGAIAARYPDFPPYGGAFDVVIPHLTVVESDEAPLEAIAAAAASPLPFGCRVDGARGPRGRRRGPLAPPLADPAGLRRFAGPPDLDRDELAVLAPGHAQPVGDLTDRRVGADRGQDRGHEVAVRAGHPLQLVHRGRPGRLGALTPDLPNPLDLASLAVGVDLLGGRRADFVVAELVDAHDDLVARVDRPLDPVGRLLDLALLEAALDRGERAAELLDLVEIGPRGSFELVGEDST